MRMYIPKKSLAMVQRELKALHAAAVAMQSAASEKA
jgi:hypothetical protein